MKDAPVVLPRPTAQRQPYDHAAWTGRRRWLRFLLRTVGFGLLAKLDHAEGLEHLPTSGPAIIMINHIAFIDPIVVMHVSPRDIVPLAKVEVYNYPVIGIIPRLWGVIPVRREEVDRRAVVQVMEVLRAGEMVLVAPEGTRSPALQTGKEGVAYLASRAQVPIIPTAVDGTIGFPALRPAKPWDQPGARVRFGRPFRYRPEFQNARHEQLRQMTDEAMYQLAALLPPGRRGVYHDVEHATHATIEWV
jgi:1-acyl-sn-glycerol-3-phosphate acyltransferase